jgi:hypothetical protein
LEAFKTLRSKSVIVLVNTKDSTSWASLPRPVQAAFADPAIGNTIPRLAVFDAKAETKLGILSYVDMKKGSSGYRPIKDAIASYKAPSPSESQEEEIAWDGTFKDTEIADWTSTKGTKIRAKVVKFSRGTATLVDEKNRKIEVTLAQLDAESGKKIEEMAEKAKKDVQLP